MKQLKDILKELNACNDAIEFVGDMTIEEAVEKCERGDWLLWIGKKLEIDVRKFTLAKAHYANTVRHLLKDERSIKAIDTAIAFGKGMATYEDLNAAAAAAANAAAAAYGAVSNAANAAAYGAAAAAYGAVSNAAYGAVSNAANAAAYGAAAAAYGAAAAAAAKKDNQLQTANICREHISQLIIDAINEKL